MTSISTRAASERITGRARQASPGRVALTVLTSALALLTWVLLGAGWLAARILGALWLGAAWCALAVAEGWAQGRTAAWSEYAAGRRQARARRTA